MVQICIIVLYCIYNYGEKNDLYALSLHLGKLFVFVLACVGGCLFINVACMRFLGKYDGVWSVNNLVK